MKREDGMRLGLAVTCVLLLTSATEAATKEQIERGKYLATVAQCGMCHTPGTLYGKPDMALRLAGSDTGWEMPGLGVFYGPNLTPDAETGLGTWSEAEIATAITTGVTPSGRTLVPVMPARSYAQMTKDDVAAIAAYLKSLPPVNHKVPGPLGADEKPPAGAVAKIVPVK
jgi:mono/diheme cytochrome c family protein